MNLRKVSKILSALGKAKLLGKRVPLVASIMPTNRCNLNCPYCGRSQRPGPELTLAQWHRIIDELAELGCVQISITGGEPLLYEGIDKLIAAAKKHDIRVNINTNGLLAAKNEAIIEQCDAVTISLDGGPEEHSIIRGRGTYEKAVEAGKLARKLGKKLTFYTVLSKHNLKALEHVARLATELGGRAFYQPGTFLDFDGIKPNPEAPAVADYRAAIDNLLALKKQGLRIGNSAAGLRYLRQWPDPAPIACHGGKLFVRIETDGTMRLCGRDGIASQINAIEGLATAIEQMPASICQSCWSAARVEFNLLVGGGLGALLNYLKI